MRVQVVSQVVQVMSRGGPVVGAEQRVFQPLDEHVQTRHEALKHRKRKRSAETAARQEHVSRDLGTYITT